MVNLPTVTIVSCTMCPVRMEGLIGIETAILSPWAGTTLLSWGVEPIACWTVWLSPITEALILSFKAFSYLRQSYFSNTHTLLFDQILWLTGVQLIRLTNNCTSGNIVTRWFSRPAWPTLSSGAWWPLGSSPRRHLWKCHIMWGVNASWREKCDSFHVWLMRLSWVKWTEAKSREVGFFLFFLFLFLCVSSVLPLRPSSLFITWM